jgi:hypothetical protein
MNFEAVARVHTWLNESCTWRALEREPVESADSNVLDASPLHQHGCPCGLIILAKVRFSDWPWSQFTTIGSACALTDPITKHTNPTAHNTNCRIRIIILLRLILFSRITFPS